jgi:hypothetical protein
MRNKATVTSHFSSGILVPHHETETSHHATALGTELLAGMCVSFTSDFVLVIFLNICNPLYEIGFTCERGVGFIEVRRYTVL